MALLLLHNYMDFINNFYGIISIWCRGIYKLLLV